MKGEIVLCVLFTATWAKPEGYYHQQYQYKSTSSSYKNNELEHKNDNEGFYSRHGDTEGRIEPKVNSYSQQSEYVNPKFQNQGQNQALQNNDFYLQQTGQGGGYNTGSGYTNAPGYTTGSGYNTGSSYNSGSSYSSSSSFGAASNSGSNQLQALQDLQNNLAKQLQQVLYEQQQKQQYPHSSSVTTGNHGSHSSYQYMEQELRNNITRELNDAVRDQRYHGLVTNDNYQQLQQQLKRDLIEQLQNSQNYKTSHSSSSSSSSAYGTTYGARPVHLTPGSQHSSFDSNSNYNTQPYAQTNPIPLQDVSNHVEVSLYNKINTAVYNKVLEYTKNYRTQPNPDFNRDLQILTSDLRRNITREFENELNKNYGRQEQRGTYYYSILPTGTQSRPNYRIDELQRLQDDLQRKLERELQTKFQQQYTQFTHTYNQQTGYTNVNPGQTIYIPSTNPHSSSQSSYGYSQQNGYTYQPTTFVISGNAPSELRRLSENVHYDLVRDLQTALEEQQRRYQQTQHSSQSYQGNSQRQPDYQALLNQLQAELQHNITTELQKHLNIQYGQQSQRGSEYYSVTGGTYGLAPNYNSQQLNDITRQLQTDLINQLQTGLSKVCESYSSHSSYSSSSSYGGQAGIKTHGSRQNYNYMADQMLGDAPYRSGYNTQEDLTQQTEDFGQLQVGQHSKKLYHQDLTQRTEDGFEKFEVGHQSQKSQTNYHDLTQQTEHYQKPQKIYGLDSNSRYNTQTYAQTNPIPLQDVSNHVEMSLYNKINTAVYNKVWEYTKNYRTQPNPDFNRDLQILTSDLRRNITREFENELNKNYGRQEQRGTNSYSILSTGAQSRPNYRIDELQRLQDDLQRKLERELQTKFQQQCTQFTQSHSQHNQQTGYTNVNHGQTHYVPTTNSHATSQNSYGYSQQNGYTYRPTTFVVSGNVPLELRRLSENVHYDLVRDLQTALQEQQRLYQQHSSQRQPNYQTLLNQLQTELQHNITRELEKHLNIQYGQQSQRGSEYFSVIGGSTSLTPNYNSQQLNDVTRQLQTDLINQLQTSLTKIRDSYSSYSSSSSYGGQTGIKTHGSQQNYNYMSDQMLGDAPYHSNYAERYNKYSPSQEEDLTQQTEDNSDQLQVGQLYKKLYDEAYQHNQRYQKPQNIYDQDLTQQTEENDEFGRLQIGQHSQKADKVYDQELTQQTQDGFGQLQVSNHDLYHSIYSGRYNKYSPSQEEDLTQQTEDNSDQLQVEQRNKKLDEEAYQHNLRYLKPQNIYDQDLTQQTDEDDEFGRLQIGQHSQKAEKVYDQELTQQTQDGFGQLQVNNLAQHQSGYSQKPKTNTDEELSQQTDVGLGQLQIGQHSQKPEKIYDQKQSEQTDDEFGQLQIGQHSQTPQKLYDQELTQQTVDELSQLQIGQHSQKPQKNYDQELTQQHEEEIGQLQVGQHSHKPHKIYDQEITQQTKDEVGQLQIEGQHSQKPQKNYDQESTQQTEDEFSQLQVGQHLQKPEKIYDQELTQQTVDELGQLQIGQHSQKPQKKYDQELTQQHEEEIGQLQVGQHSHKPHRVYDQEITQQTKDEIGELQIGHHSQKPQKNYDQESTQQTQDEFSQVQVGQHLQKPEKIYDQELTQQTEAEFGQLHVTQQIGDEFGQLQVGQHSQKPHKVYDQELTQQIEEEFDQLPIGQHYQKPQKKYDQERTQQTEDAFSQLQVGQPLQKPEKIFDQELRQQTEVEFGQLQVGQHSQRPQKIYDQELTQKTEDESSQLQVGQHYQKPKKIYDQELTQQTEDGLSPLQIGRHSQKPQTIAQQTEDGFEQLQIGQHKDTLVQKPVRIYKPTNFEPVDGYSPKPHRHHDQTIRQQISSGYGLSNADYDIEKSIPHKVYKVVTQYTGDGHSGQKVVTQYTSDGHGDQKVVTHHHKVYEPEDLDSIHHHHTHAIPNPKPARITFGEDRENIFAGQFQHHEHGHQHHEHGHHHHNNRHSFHEIERKNDQLLDLLSQKVSKQTSNNTPGDMNYPHHQQYVLNQPLIQNYESVEELSPQGHSYQPSHSHGYQSSSYSSSSSSSRSHSSSSTPTKSHSSYSP